MKLINILIFIVILLSFPLSNLAQEPLSLQQAVAQGIDNNYQVKIAAQNVEIASNNNNWGTAGAYPNVNLNLDWSNAFTNTSNPASVLVESSILSNGLAPSATASWTLFDGFRIRLTKDQLEELERQSNINSKIAIENTVQAIVLAYYQILIQEEQLQVLKELLDLSRDRIDYQEVRKEFGQAGTFDLLQDQDAYLNDSTNYLVQQTNLQNAFRNLALAMGITDQRMEYELTDPLVFDAPNYSLEELKTEMFANNYNLRNLQANRSLAQINTQLQEAAKYPTVTINTGVSYNADLANGNQVFNFGGTENENNVAGVRSNTFNGFINLSASYNLFNGGVRKRNIENAQTQELIAQLNIEDLKLQLGNQLENIYATYNNQKQLVKLTENLLNNAGLNLKIAEERFKGGLINSFDYRTIQLAYINASQARLNAFFNLKVTETELLRLVGRLVR